MAADGDGATPERDPTIWAFLDAIFPAAQALIGLREAVEDLEYWDVDLGMRIAHEIDRRAEEWRGDPDLRYEPQEWMEALAEELFEVDDGALARLLLQVSALAGDLKAARERSDEQQDPPQNT